jgi:hypothetical protein
MFTCFPCYVLFLGSLLLPPLKRVFILRIAIVRRTPATLCWLVYIRRGRNHDWLMTQQVSKGRDSTRWYSVINLFQVLFFKLYVFLLISCWGTAVGYSKIRRWGMRVISAAEYIHWMMTNRFIFSFLGSRSYFQAVNVIQPVADKRQSPFFLTLRHF